MTPRSRQLAFAALAALSLTAFAYWFGARRGGQAARATGTEASEASAHVNVHLEAVNDDAALDEPRTSDEAASSRTPSRTTSVLVRARWADNGAPASERTISLRLETNPWFGPNRRTDSEGVALFEPAPVGLYSVECGGVMVAHGEALPLERSTIEVELERPIQVDVTCVDGKKRPIADARVLAGGGGGGPFTEVGRTDSLGRCRVAEAHSDAQWYAYSPELACRDAVALPKGSGAQATVKLVLDRASESMSVRVVDERRRAIPGATVWLSFGSSRGWLFSRRLARVTKSNAEGLATVEGLPERANVKLSIHARGFAPLGDVDDNDFERDETGAVCIEMSAGANVRGIAMLEGRPAKHAWVIAGDFLSGSYDMALTDSNGRYRVGSLPAGEISLGAFIPWKDGVRLPATDDVETEDVWSAKVELQLNEGADHVWNPVLEREKSD